MKLFLCGGGSGKQINDVYRYFSNILDKSKPILYIPFAMDDIKYDNCYTWFSKEIAHFGVTDFEMVRNCNQLLSKNFNNYSAIFIGGGNTFKLLSELKKGSIIPKLDEYLKNDGIIFGGSAGAIIFGRDINSCLMNDENLIGLKDCSGLDMLNHYSILCHYNETGMSSNSKNYLLDYSKKYATICLPETGTIMVDNKNIIFLGHGKCAIFKNGKLSKHYFANMNKLNF